MDALTIYNTFLRYSYFILIIILFIAIIKIFKSLLKLANTSSKILNNSININNQLIQTENKLNKIEYTTRVSIPYFLNLFMIIAIINEITKDYFNTKQNKRNLRKSFNKIYKIEKRVNSAFSLGKMFKKLIRY